MNQSVQNLMVTKKKYFNYTKIRSKETKCTHILQSI